MTTMDGKKKEEVKPKEKKNETEKSRAIVHSMREHQLMIICTTIIGHSHTISC